MSRRALIIAIVVALIPAAWFTARAVFAGDDPADPGTGSTEKPIPSIGVTTPPGSTPTTSTRTPTATPSTKAPSLPRVEPDVPRRLTSGSVIDAGFDDSVEPDGDSFSSRTSSEVSRWGSRGEPGSPGSDTVYVVGRVESGAAFEDLGQLGTGDTITIRTDNGTLGYRVTATRTAAESGLGKDPLITAKVPGRLVLIGTRDNDYLLVTAQLSSATAA